MAAPGAPGAELSYWEGINPFAMLGVQPTSAVDGAARAGGINVPPGIARIAGPGVLSAGGYPPWSPHNALFWFGLILGSTLGFVAVSTSARVGTVKAGVSIGQGAD